jgi:hypothetical protein
MSGWQDSRRQDGRTAGWQVGSIGKRYKQEIGFWEIKNKAGPKP